MDQFINEKFDYVITLCDDAAKFCPNFGGHGKRLHWPFEDPAAAIGTIEERLAVFRRVRDEIKAKIEEFLKSESSEIPDPIAHLHFTPLPFSLASPKLSLRFLESLQFPNRSSG